jgi:hypothetical protein
MAPKKEEPAARKKKDPTRALPELDANRHQDAQKNRAARGVSGSRGLHDNLDENEVACNSFSVGSVCAERDFV